MASIINALTSGGGVAITPDTSGVLQLATNNGTTAVTISTAQVVTLANALPIASGGTGMTSAAPAFNATLSGDQTIAASTYSKVLFNTTSVNLGSCFSTANNRFQPTTAGYYYVSVKLNMRGYGSTNCTTYLVGSGGTQLASTIMLQNGYGYFSYVDKLLYFNGSTDFVEVYWNSGTLEYIAGGGIESMFKAYFVRG